MREKLPHSNASLVLGILSIVLCCLPYGLGAIFGVIGILQGNKAIAIHNESPENYEGIGNAKAGKITSIIGLILVLILVAIGIYLTTHPELMEQLKTWAEEQQANQ